MSAMTKGVLARRRRELEVYARVLPSLDLKRQQLAALLAQERHGLEQARNRLDAALQAAAQRLPMLGLDPDETPAHGELETVTAPPERVLGVALPGPAALQWRPDPPAWLSTPHWTELARQAQRELVALALDIRRREQRLDLLDAALRKTLKRVNLFEQVLIPRARTEIRALGVFLADQERAAIVRAKQARQRRHRPEAHQ